MILKPEVRDEGVCREIWYALGVADALYQQMTRQLTVTSLKDSHDDKPLSLHNQGRACDLRTRDLPMSQTEALRAKLSQLLEPLGFDVVLEQSPQHLHVEFDPKNNETFFKRLEVPKT